jgi:hypothetical protein
MNKTDTKKKLQVNMETIRKLGQDELKVVAGGRGAPALYLTEPR